MGGTPTAKVIPPSAPTLYLRREQLLERLGEALRCRLTTVVAGAGFGKSTLLADWATGVPSTWYTMDRADAPVGTCANGFVDTLRLVVPSLPDEVTRAVEGPLGPEVDDRSRADAVAALLCEALQQQLDFDAVLVLDDVHEIGRSAPASRLIEGLVRHAPPNLHIVLSSRSDPPFPVERLRGQGQVLDISAPMLAFSEEEVRALVVSSLGEESSHLAGRLHALTRGWPAAVRLAIEALRVSPPEERSAALVGLQRPGGPLLPYLAREVFAREQPAVRELVGRVALVDRFTVGLCERLGMRRAEETIGDLVRRGLFVEPRATIDGWYTLNDLVREYALEHLSPQDEDARRLLVDAADWLQSHGHILDSLRALLAARDEDGLARLLETHGEELVAGGQVDEVIEATDTLSDAARDFTVEQLAGQARQVRGDWDGALACFDRAAAGTEELPPGLAWRIGLIHYLRGTPDRALEAFARGRVDGSDLTEEAQLLAWTATAHWAKGEADACRELVDRALEAALASRNPRPLATAHTVLGMLAASDGDTRATDAHYLKALDAADKARDVLQTLRIRSNRGAHLALEGSYEQALAELEVAIRLAEVTGFQTFLALALNNRGQVGFRQGRLEQAAADFEASRSLYQRQQSSYATYPTEGLASVQRERGNLASARSGYERAVALSEAAGNVQGLVPALIGLALVLASDDPAEARSLAARAVSVGRPGRDYVRTRIAAGWVALARQDITAARAFAEDCVAAARGRPDRQGLAESLELLAATSPDDGELRGSLTEAISIWREIGNELGAARCELALARLSSDPAVAGSGERAERKLLALGVRIGTPIPGLLSLVGTAATAPLEIQTLGSFAVVRDGSPVPASEWKSRKARDLLKILVARRGRLTPRDLLMETLWPKESPEKLANRLSVALSTVRGVLDPERRFEPEHYLVADRSTIALSRTNLSVDVERFLVDAEAGLALMREGRDDEGVEVLRSAESAYTGDFLEEDAYEDWAVPLREEGRTVFSSVARALAETALESGDHDSAVRFYLRLLERDPFDESAYLGVIDALERGGRRGEARRWYRTYVARMEELGVESTPFPTTARV